MVNHVRGALDRRGGGFDVELSNLGNAHVTLANLKIANFFLSVSNFRNAQALVTIF